MPAFVRSLLLVASLEFLLASAALAQQGVYLPPAPQGPGGEDTIESASGTRCRQSINSNKGYLDVGVSGTARSEVPNGKATPGGLFPSGVFVTINDRDREALAYARITIPLGTQPKRIDCSRIYELEIDRLRQEIALLKINAE
jgi:hypothetical protein